MNEPEGNLKRTALYDKHVALGGKMVPFAGYSMPVQYQGGVIAEHMAVRTKAGLFDVSHMGEVRITGGGAFTLVQNLICNDISAMKDGDCRYSPMLNEQGGIVDDLLVYRFGENDYLLVINASNREKDVRWIIAHNDFGAVVTDISDTLSELALQGPAAKGILGKLTAPDTLPGRYYTFRDAVNVGGIKCLVSRTGYTGEHGYELYCDNESAPKLWDLLLESGGDEGLIPCGLGARDTLRLEAAMPLYGHEMNDDITPFEASLDIFVKMNKDSFVGKDALAGREQPDKRRVCLRMTGRGIAREQYPVFKDGVQIGVVTSGTQLPFAGFAGAMALIDANLCAPGTALQVDARGRLVDCEVIPSPFYSKPKKP